MAQFDDNATAAAPKKSKNDAYFNPKSVMTADGKQLDFYSQYGLGFSERGNKGLNKALIQACRENGGELELTMKGTVRLNEQGEIDTSSFEGVTFA